METLHAAALTASGLMTAGGIAYAACPGGARALYRDPARSGRLYAARRRPACEDVRFYARGGDLRLAGWYPTPTRRAVQ